MASQKWINGLRKNRRVSPGWKLVLNSILCKCHMYLKNNKLKNDITNCAPNLKKKVILLNLSVYLFGSITAQTRIIPNNFKTSIWLYFPTGYNLRKTNKQKSPTEIVFNGLVISRNVGIAILVFGTHIIIYILHIYINKAHEYISVIKKQCFKSHRRGRNIKSNKLVK